MFLAGTSYFLPSLSLCLFQPQVPASKTTARYASIELEPTTQTYLSSWARVLGIVKLRSQPRKRTYDRHGLCRDCIAATFRRMEVFVSRLFILSIDIAQTWSAIFIIRFLIVFCKLHNNISVSEVALVFVSQHKRRFLRLRNIFSMVG